MRGLWIKWAAALLVAGVGFAPLAQAFLYKAPDLAVATYPNKYDDHARPIFANGACNEIYVGVRNLSPIPVTRSFEVEVFLGRKQNGKLVYYTGSRYRRTVEGLPGNDGRRLTITGFKITEALKGRGLYIVAVIDSTGRITEQSEINNRAGYFLKDELLDNIQPCK